MMMFIYDVEKYDETNNISIKSKNVCIFRYLPLPIIDQMHKSIELLVHCDYLHSTPLGNLHSKTTGAVFPLLANQGTCKPVYILLRSLPYHLHHSTFVLCTDSVGSLVHKCIDITELIKC